MDMAGKMSGIDRHSASGQEETRNLPNATGAQCSPPVEVNSKSGELPDHVPLSGHERVERTSDTTESARNAEPKWYQPFRAGHGARVHRLAASLLVAIAASAFGTPALADSHCDATDANELWCATMTVAVSGNNTGFQNGAGQTFGTLSDDDFIVASATQRIWVLSYNATAGLSISMTPGFSLTTFGKLKLTVGSTDFAYDAVGATDTEVWSAPGLSWSSGDTVAVKLVRVSNTAPTLANTIPDVSAVVGTQFSYTVPADTFTDADGDEIRDYLATKTDGNAFPTWLAFTPRTQTFTGTPMTADVGTVSVRLTAGDGFSRRVSDDFDIAVSRTAQNAPWDIRAESPSGTSAIVRVRWNAPTDLAGAEAYYVRVRKLGDQTSFRYRRVGLDAGEELWRYLEPDTTYEASVCAGEDVGDIRLYVASQLVDSPRYDHDAVCSGWTSIRLPPAPANDFTLSLELPGGGTKATVAWDGTLRYRIRVSGVYDSSVLEFHSSTVGIAATRLGPPGERIPEFTTYGSNSYSDFSYRGMARKFIVWDSPTSGYWERTQTVWSGVGANESHVLELIDQPARFMGSRMNRIGAPSSLCVEITNSMGTVTGPCAAEQVEVDPPVVMSTPSVSPAGGDRQWTEDETVEVTLAFSEAVEVDTSGGTPSVGIRLSGTEARGAGYLRGSGTAELVFAYTLVTDDGTHTSMAVTPDSLALNGGTIQSVATSADAVLGHNGTFVQGGAGRSTQGPSARFSGLPANHDGTTAFTVELHFSAEPEGLSYRTVQGGLLEVGGAAVTRAVRATPGSNMGWRVTVAPSGDGEIEIGLPARKCGTPNAVCIGGRPLEHAAQATIPGTVQVEPPPPPASALDGIVLRSAGGA